MVSETSTGWGCVWGQGWGWGIWSPRQPGNGVPFESQGPPNPNPTPNPVPNPNPDPNQDGVLLLLNVDPDPDPRSPSTLTGLQRGLVEEQAQPAPRRPQPGGVRAQRTGEYNCLLKVTSCLC